MVHTRAHTDKYHAFRNNGTDGAQQMKEQRKPNKKCSRFLYVTSQDKIAPFCDAFVATAAWSILKWVLILAHLRRSSAQPWHKWYIRRKCIAVHINFIMRC